MRLLVRVYRSERTAGKSKEWHVVGSVYENKEGQGIRRISGHTVCASTCSRTQISGKLHISKGETLKAFFYDDFGSYLRVLRI